MSWFEQSRVLELSGAALPKWRDENLFTVSRVHGTEKISRLYSYTVEVATLDDRSLHVSEAKKLVDVDQLVGKQVTIRIALSGNGTWAAGQVGGSGSENIGAGVREITGLIVSAQAVGADDRRAFYRLQVRPWLHLATLNRDSRLFLNASVRDISEAVLKKYPYPYELRLNGPGRGRKQYPTRDYQRMFWESDYDLLKRLWQEFGISYYYQGSTLVLCDSPGGFRKHGPAYQTIRYLAPEGQRIDEEHIHRFEIARKLTTGKVSAIDYDYTQSLRKLDVKDTEYADRSFDNYEEYAWGDYAQPLEGPMGTAGQPNDVKFEGAFLARVRLEAHRCRSLRAKGKGNLRGLMAGHTFRLEGFPLEPGDGNYLVISTKLDIRNNDTATQSGGANAGYSCETRFTVQPLAWGYRTPLKAKKPRSHSEIAVVTGYENQTTCTDQYGRVKVQFKWDRERPADQNSSCWIRVSSPWQGEGYGAIYIPRVGQEVVIGYHDNDPDKPFIIGRHINRWQPSPWALPDNQALSGWRSRDASDKSVAANSVVTDDTPGKLQVQVSSDQAQSRLVLGSNTRIDGHKGRAQARGEGFELATGGHGVGRANRGLLLTTETRAGATQPMKDMGETVHRLTQARQQHEDLGALAQKHQAQTPQANQQDAAQTIKTQNTAIKGGTASLDNPSPEMTRPDFVAASAAGIAMTATDSTHLASQNDLAVTAGRDVSYSAGRSYHVSVRGPVSLFSYQLGMNFVAAQGPMVLQAQSGPMSLAALKDLTVSSTDGKVVITAAKEVWIGAGGSYIQINGSGIINGSPGPILEKTPKWSKSGADSKRVPLPGMPIPENEQFFSNRLDLSEAGQVVADLPHPWANLPYLVTDHTGNILTSGTLDEAGSASRVFARQAQDVDAWVGTSGWGATEESLINDGSEEMRA
jgi:type VI secretion system secreted protein VgrG